MILRSDTAAPPTLLLMALSSCLVCSSFRAQRTVARCRRPGGGGVFGKFSGNLGSRTGWSSPVPDEKVSDNMGGSSPDGDPQVSLTHRSTDRLRHCTHPSIRWITLPPRLATIPADDRQLRVGLAHAESGHPVTRWPEVRGDMTESGKEPRCAEPTERNPFIARFRCLVS